MADVDIRRYKFIKKGYWWQTKITCPVCKKERWVHRSAMVRANNFTGMCRSCSSRINMKRNTSKHPDLNRVEKKLNIKLGFIRDKGGNLVSWIICPKCKKGRWVTEYNIFKSRDWTKRCPKCNGYPMEKNPNWRGGKITNGGGYIQIKLKRDDPLFIMQTRAGYVLEHRYLMAKKIGRALKSHEVVHHLNGIKNDNRISNLEMIGGKNSAIKHTVITLQQKRIRELEKLLKIKEK